MRECEHECRRVRARMCERVCVKAGECTVCTFVRVCMYVCMCVCVCVCVRGWWQAPPCTSPPALLLRSSVPPSAPSAVQLLLTRGPPFAPCPGLSD